MGDEVTREIAGVLAQVLSVGLEVVDETVLAALEICALLDEGGVDVDFPRNLAKSVTVE